MKLFQRIAKRGVYGYNRNSLHPFERELLSAVEQAETHNILFMSIQAQLRHFLTLKTNRIVGIPDWFSREYRDGCIIVRQQRYVGGECGPPPIEPKPSFCLDILQHGDIIGKIQIDVDQAIRKIITQFKNEDIEYPASFDGIGISVDEVSDEREYWFERRDLLGRTSKLVSFSVESGIFMDNILVCNPRSTVADSLLGISLCPSYQKLLRFCDGIRVNDLIVYGLLIKRNRLFEEEGCGYLKAGEDAEYTYAYPIFGKKTSEKLVRFRNQNGCREDIDMSVLGLLENALI